VSSQADSQSVQRRPLIAPHMTKLTQVRFDSLFESGSSLISPVSLWHDLHLARWRPLSDPKLHPYKFLIVDNHRVGGGRL